MADGCAHCANFAEAQLPGRTCPVCGARRVPKGDMSDNLYAFAKTVKPATAPAKSEKMETNAKLSIQKFDQIIDEHLQRAHAMQAQLEWLHASIGGTATEDDMAKLGARLAQLASEDFVETQKSMSDMRTLFLNDNIFSELLEHFNDC